MQMNGNGHWRHITVALQCAQSSRLGIPQQTLCSIIGSILTSTPVLAACYAWITFKWVYRVQQGRDRQMNQD